MYKRQELTITVVDNSRNLALSPYANISLPYSFAANAKSVSTISNIVLLQCIKESTKPNGIFDEVEVTGHDIVMSESFSGYWLEWWKLKSKEVNVDMFTFLALVTELTAAFAYVEKHIKSADVDVGSDRVLIKKDIATYPLAQQVVEYRYAIPYSPFVKSAITVSIHQLFAEAKSVVVYDKARLSLSGGAGEKYDPNEIEDGITFSGSISHNAIVESLSNLDEESNLLLTNLIEDFDDDAIQQGNIFTSVADVGADGREHVHLFYHYVSELELRETLIALRGMKRRVTLHLSPRFYDESASVIANTLLLKRDRKSLNKAYSLFKQGLISLDARKRAQVSNFVDYIDPITANVMSGLSKDVSMLTPTEKQHYLRHFVRQCKIASILQKKAMLNMSSHDV